MEIIAVVIFEQGNPDVGEHEVLVEIVEEFDNARVPNVLEDGWFGELRKHRSIVKSGEETAAGVPWFSSAEFSLVWYPACKAVAAAPYPRLRDDIEEGEV